MVGLIASSVMGLLLSRDEGLEIQAVESEKTLKEAVTEGEYIAGIVLPVDMKEKFLAGQKPTITVYFASDVPAEIKDAVEFIIRELAYQQTGQPLALEVSEEIIGPDMMGMQKPPRNRLRPLFAVLLIVIETLGLANLISEEVERGTIHALLVTPMTVKELFAAKGITGMSLAFGQSLLFMAIVGGLSRQPLIILVALLLGGVLFTGLGFLIAAAAKDFMSVMAWGMMLMIILMIPALSVMSPGLVTGWVKVIPSYYLVDTVHRVSNFGVGWGDIWYNLLILLGFDLAVVCSGIIALGRKSR